MTIAYGFPDLAFFAVLLLQVICLALLTQFVLRHNNRLHRVLVPVLALAGTGIAGGLLKQIGPDMGSILLFMIPPLAILTLFPFFEPYFRIERKAAAIAGLSVVLIIAVFLYLFGMAYGGVGIFLPVAGISLFSSVWFEVRLVSIYLELLMLGGALLGTILLVHEVAPEQLQDPVFTGIVCMILGITAASFNSLAPGFLAVFFCSLLSGIKSTAGRILVPVSCAIGIAFLLSSLPATYQYADVARRYDPSLYIVVLVALGAVTLLPLVSRYADTRYRNISLYATATITVVILVFMYHSPAQDLFHALVAGVSTLAGSGLFTPGAAPGPGMARLMLLYLGAAVIAVVIFAGIALATTLIRRRNNPPLGESIPRDNRIRK